MAAKRRCALRRYSTISSFERVTSASGAESSAVTFATMREARAGGFCAWMLGLASRRTRVSQETPVVIDERDRVVRIVLARRTRDPVPRIVGEEREPVVEPPLVEKARLVDEKPLGRGKRDRHGAAVM